MLIGLLGLLFIGIVVCFFVRIFSGHAMAKRMHEYIVGQGLYYWLVVSSA